MKNFWRNNVNFAKDFQYILNKFLFIKTEFITNLLTFGKSLRWLASSKSSSRLLAYLMISSGTFANDWCRLSMYSTWRLHPLNKGIHLNILTEFSRNYYIHKIIYSFSTKNFSFNVDTPANLSRQPRPLWECIQG